MIFPWQPIAYILGAGILVGLITGAAIRRLNKVIAAAIGFALLTVNFLWFMRVFNIDLPMPSHLVSIIDAFVRLIPIATQDLVQNFGPVLPLLTSVPFITGFFIGAWIGFRIA